MIAEDLNRIADDLVKIANDLPKLATGISRHPEPLHLPQLSAVEVARALLASRRRRNLMFADYVIFGEPAWDMLLDLFIATETGKLPSVSGLCYTSAVPASTALRHVSVLEEHGLIERRPDQSDGRRTYLLLSDKGSQLMRMFLQRRSAVFETLYPAPTRADALPANFDARRVDAARVSAVT